MSDTKLFCITWDNARIVQRTKYRKIPLMLVNAEGVHFANGRIALDNGVMFASKFEMEEHFKTVGDMSMKYQGEE